MNFANYTALKSAIADELNRTDLDTAIPGFISLMESQTERQLRTREMLSQVNFTVDSEFENIPADFLETRRFELQSNPVQLLEYQTPDQSSTYKQYYPFGAKPMRFTVIGEQFQFLPAPNASFTAVLLYYKQIPRLSDVTPTNWLLTKHPDIYFYGSLLNTAPYLKEDARLAVWAQLYQAAVDSLNVADERAQTASHGLKIRSRSF